ncbi:MAG: hypothetical protein C0467_21690 [Planctomycetaceae bacterium]|nr:hypothetical protein [Planctomycetaceae bacterium]
MTAEVRVIAAESDPVSAALADPVVHGRLLAAARTCLGRRATTLSRTQRAAEAEEITSKTQMEALKRRASFDPSRDVVSWLVGFVVNVTRDHLRKHARTPTHPPPNVPGLEDLAVDLGRPVADSLADKEFMSKLLDQLPSDERELLLQKYRDDQTFAEIAEGRGSTETAVRVRCHRIIQRLRQQYGASGEVQS